jgi:two-component system response regulator PilR (NtrC family)
MMSMTISSSTTSPSSARCFRRPSRGRLPHAEAANAAEGLEKLSKEAVDLLLLDLMLPDRPGMEVLAEARGRYPDLPVVVVTAYSSVESAIAAMREGAFHYLAKPFRNEEVVHVVKQALEARRLIAENRTLKERLDRSHGDLKEIVGRSAPMEKIFETIRQAAAARSTVLIVGESGTGKELVAKALHRLSPRAGGPFVTVHSGALPADLLESNLFGHVRGSFTGAVADKKGLFKAADGGTIFFDEIGTVPQTQANPVRPPGARVPARRRGRAHPLDVRASPPRTPT